MECRLRGFSAVRPAGNTPPPLSLGESVHSVLVARGGSSNFGFSNRQSVGQGVVESGMSLNHGT